MSDPAENKKSKGQKKKEKEKLKAMKDDNEEVVAEEEVKEEVKEEGKDNAEQSAAKAAKGKKKAGKGPGNLMAKLAQERLQKLKEEEEEEKRREEEEERVEAERIRLIKEAEAKRKEEEAARKKEKDDKIALLKGKGLLLSKKDRERRERLLAEGLIEENEMNEEQQEELIKQAKEKMKNKKKPKKEESILDNPNLVLISSEVKSDGEEKEGEKEGDWETQVGGGEEQKSSTIQTQEQIEKKAKAKANKTTIDEESKIAEKIKSMAAFDSTKLQIVPESEYRSAICCIMGHVDTGKTTLLDKIRNTNVQEGEAGGITQQIGATYFPPEKLNEEISKIKGFYKLENILPGLLIIDTPGHESFANLRSRGSSLCDIGILVIDLMHGLENQTLESIEMLRSRKTPFVIALNKIDRIFEWKTVPMRSSYEALRAQGTFQKDEFENKSRPIITQLAEKELNVALYWDNPDPRTYINVVPTSGITGEGIPDLLGVIVTMTSKYMWKQVKINPELFSCTVLEVKLIEGLGVTIDCILVQGEVREGDTIMLQGFDGPISTTIRALLTPHPMQEMRVKGEYVHHKQIRGAIGIKISATKLENAVAGSAMFIVKSPDQVEGYKIELQREMDAVKKKVKLSKSGVCVAASTLGSLEALLEFLKTCKIPVSYIVVGPVHKDDVMKALKPIISDDEKKMKREHAVVLAFDVKIHPDAQDLADSYKIKIFTADIIYHLFDQFTAYLKELKEAKKKEMLKEAVFPCILKPVAFFNKKDPIVMGIDVERGFLRPGTPIGIIRNGEKLKIGVVESIELNHKQLKEARPNNGSVAIMVKGEPNVLAGRHFEVTDKLISFVTRRSIDVLKDYFREEMTNSDWDLIREMKKFFKID